MGVVANQGFYDFLDKFAGKVRRKRRAKKMTDVEIKRYDEFVTDAKLVREEVFMAEQGFSYDYDETDDVAVHFVMYRKDEAVGACRVFEGEGEKTYVLGRLAVKKECRGKGYGSVLIDSAKEYVKSEGGEQLVLHSQLQAKEFYSKNGFFEYGEVEYEEDCPHIWMRAVLK